MRTFLDIQHAHGLKKFFDHPFGTTYYSPVRPRVAPIHVRHFDSALPPAMIGAFVDLIRATQQWVTRHPELARLVQVKPISEVGVDFVARPFYGIYNTTTSAYDDWDDPPEPPSELAEMQTTFQALHGHTVDSHDAIVEAVLARSLLEPSGKTYFNPATSTFIVVEPRLVCVEVERWAALLAPPDP